VCPLPFWRNTAPNGARCPQAPDPSGTNTPRPVPAQGGPKGAVKRTDETMFAVMKTGGKQYRVQAGDTLRVEKLAAAAGDTVQFNEVLMVGATVGAPRVDGAAVQATVVDHVKSDKTIHFVKRRRKHGSQRTKGHRQQLTLVKVTEILATGADATGVKPALGATEAKHTN
jgi:large subunit ribosomal protein L21